MRTLVSSLVHPLVLLELRLRDELVAGRTRKQVARVDIFKMYSQLFFVHKILAAFLVQAENTWTRTFAFLEMLWKICLGKQFLAVGAVDSGRRHFGMISCLYTN
ncbi:unnamed protein product [Ectocarpus sp. 12 AP-2014]